MKHQVKSTSPKDDIIDLYFFFSIFVDILQPDWARNLRCRQAASSDSFLTMQSQMWAKARKHQAILQATKGFITKFLGLVSSTEMKY